MRFFIFICTSIFIGISAYLFFFSLEKESFEKLPSEFLTFDESPQKNQAAGIGQPSTYSYKNAARDFSLNLPATLSSKEYDEGDGSYTVVFEESQSGKEFQIYMTPYYPDAITYSRMREDIPSGVFSEPEEILLPAGMRALTFFSSGPLGEMREVWFIHNKYLYEATTLKENDAWFSEVLATLSFSQENE